MKRETPRVAIAALSPVFVFAVFVAVAPARAAESAVEDTMIVTGSYIRGTPEDAAVPVDVVSREDMIAQGAVLPSDVINNLTVNSGSTTNFNTDAENGNLTAKGNVNLRGLGVNSTLVLVNGKRQTAAAARTQAGETFVDIDEIPSIMIERVEVLKNGASATYGSDAIAGVVNFITRDDFEGFEFSSRYLETDDSDQSDVTVGALFGWASDDQRTRVVIGADYLNRSELRAGDKDLQDGRLLSTSGIHGARVTNDFSGASAAAAAGIIGDPATAMALFPDAFGRNDAFATVGVEDNDFTDPSCTAAGGFVGIQGDAERAECRFDTRDFQIYVPETDRVGTMMQVSHRISDTVELYGEALYTDTNSYRLTADVSSPVGTNFLQLPVGVPVYGLGSIAPDGSLRLGLGPGDPLPDPAAAPVRAENGGFGNLNTMDFSVGTYGPTTTAKNDSKTQRYLIGANGELDLAERRVYWDASYSYSSNESVRREDSLDKDRMELALNGLGGPDCEPNGVRNLPLTEDGLLGAFWSPFQFFLDAPLDPEYPNNSRGNISLALSSTNHGQGGCMFFNPYLSAQTGVGPANDPALLDWMRIRDVVLNDSTTELSVFDLVVSTDLIELEHGPVSAAFGLQWREDSRDSKQQAERFGTTLITAVDPATGETTERPVTNDAQFGTLTNVFDASQDAFAAFAEAKIPVLDTLEVQLATRYESIGLDTDFEPESLSYQGVLDNVDDDLGDELTSKLAVRWQPLDTLALRFSYGQAFRAPNLGLLFEGSGYDGEGTVDPLHLQAVRNGSVEPEAVFSDPALAGASQRTFLRLGLPSPELEPETADSYDVGFIWTPTGALDGLSLSADYFLVDYDDAIVPTPFPQRFQEQIDLFNEVKQDPDNYIDTAANDAPCMPGSAATCVVDPMAYFIPAQPGEPAPIERIGSTLAIVRIRDINAGSVKTDGLDIKGGYRWEARDIGSFNLATEWTWINKFDVTVGDTEFDAAGHTNDDFGVRSMPDLRGNATLSWFRGDHSLTAIARRIASYHDDFNDNTIESYTTYDLQYTYDWDWSSAQSPLRLRLGVIDVTDEDLPRRDRIGRGFDTTVFNPNGRRFYLQLTQRL